MSTHWAGSACVVYFIIIVVYAGISTSFASYGCFCGLLLVFLVYGKWYYARNMERSRWCRCRWLPLVLREWLCWESSVSWYFWEKATPGKGQPGLCVIVLGVRVKEHTVSNSRKASGPGHCLCGGESVHHSGALSAARGRGKCDSEAQVMYDYLVYNVNVPGSWLYPIPARWRTLLTARFVIEQDR